MNHSLLKSSESFFCSLSCRYVQDAASGRQAACWPPPPPRSLIKLFVIQVDPNQILSSSNLILTQHPRLKMQPLVHLAGRAPVISFSHTLCKHRQRVLGAAWLQSAYTPLCLLITRNMCAPHNLKPIAAPAAEDAAAGR